MTAKNLLSQSYHLDQNIDGKIKQIVWLNTLVSKFASASPSEREDGTPLGMESSISKIVDLEAEIVQNLVALVDLKIKIVSAINTVESIEYRTILELRYLCLKSWEQIAVLMGYSVSNVHSKHGKALSQVRIA